MSTFDLDERQLQAVRALRGPVQILAGAGTGKTRTITHRIAAGVEQGVYDPRTTLAVTFTTKAAGEMGRRLSVLGAGQVRVRTFHSAALRQLRYFWPRLAPGRQFPDIQPSKAATVGAALSRLQLPSDPATVRDVAAEIEWAKVSQIAPRDYAESPLAAGRDAAGLNPAQLAKAYLGYEELKTSGERIDFEDVLLLTVGALASREDFRREVQQSFAHITVDEYQDVSPLQQRLLELWLGDSEELCVVGDASQTIYTFAGARADFLTGFASRYPGAAVIKLERSYRCTPQIVDLANRVIGPDALTLQSSRDAGALPPVIRQFDDEVAEADWVAEQVSRRVADGVPASEIAVLVRMNAMTEEVERALAERRMPFVVRGSTRFWERGEVRQAVTMMRGAAVSAGSTGEQDLVATVHGVLAGIGWTAEPPTSMGAVRERWESWTALASLAQELANQSPDAGLVEFVQECVRRSESADAPSADAVTIASLHSAKGLEWDRVFIIGATDGVIPLVHASTPEEIAEERRLLYVGVTRARDELVLTWAQARNPGGRASRSLSRFLRDEGSRTERPRAKSPRAARRGLAKCRLCGKGLATAQERTLMRCSTCPSDVDESLLAGLKEWRSQQVEIQSAERESKMPAYVVATDATLLAIAEQRPGDVDALAAVPGMGPAKIERYGSELLALIALSDLARGASG